MNCTMIVPPFEFAWFASYSRVLSPKVHALVQAHENEKMHCKDKGVHMKEKAGKDNEGKMVVHKELDALIVQFYNAKILLLTAGCVISLRFDGLKVCW